METCGYDKVGRRDKTGIIRGSSELFEVVECDATVIGMCFDTTGSNIGTKTIGMLVLACKYWHVNTGMLHVNEACSPIMKANSHNML